MTTCVLSWYWRSGADDSWGMFGALNWEGKMFDSEAYAQLVRKSRSYRRFDEGETVDVATLRDLIDLTRMTPSASNAQPMVYIPVADPETKAKVFPCLGWAGALKAVSYTHLRAHETVLDLVCR